MSSFRDALHYLILTVSSFQALSITRASGQGPQVERLLHHQVALLAGSARTLMSADIFALQVTPKRGAQARPERATAQVPQRLWRSQDLMGSR